MKNAKLLFITIFLTISAFGQEGYFMLKKKEFECSNNSRNSSLYFVKYMSEDMNSSAKIIVDSWETKCGLTEPVYRAKILLALKTRQLSDSLFSKISIDHIFNYQNRMKGISSSGTYWYESRELYYGYVPPNQDFDNYTRELALDLKNNYPQETIEYALAEFYSTNYDSIFFKLQLPAYQESALVREYYAVAKKYRKMSEFHLAAIIGIWIPTGKLAVLGAHPEIGFQIGWKKRKMNYDFTQTIRFLNSPNSYYALNIKSNSYELTNFFFGIYFGFDTGADLFVKNGHEIQLTGGIAFDGIGVSGNTTALSYNFNLGLGYRYYVRNEVYLGTKIKYNVVDYTLEKIIDFNGHPITIHFIVGGVNNRYRNKSLQALKYPLRK